MNEEYYINELKKRDLIISRQADEIKFLHKEISLLRDIITKNSSNSGKPPSTDGFSKKRTVSLRKKSSKKTGGQPGHKGSFLRQSDNADETFVESPDECSCGCDLRNEDILKSEYRQVFDIPEIKIHVTEYVSESKRCPKCLRIIKGCFPPGVNAPVVYGENIKSAASYLHNYQLIPFNRTVQLMRDLFGAKVSEGWLNNIRAELSDSPVFFCDTAERMLCQSSVVNFDETGISVNGWKTLASCCMQQPFYTAVPAF